MNKTSYITNGDPKLEAFVTDLDNAKKQVAKLKAEKESIEKAYTDAVMESMRVKHRLTTNLVQEHSTTKKVTRTICDDKYRYIVTHSTHKTPRLFKVEIIHLTGRDSFHTYMDWDIGEDEESLRRVYDEMPKTIRKRLNFNPEFTTEPPFVAAGI